MNVKSKKSVLRRIRIRTRIRAGGHVSVAEAWNQ